MSRIHNTIASQHCTSLSYYKQGSGPAVVFIHGFPEDASVWFSIMDKLDSNYTLIAIDLPGVGKSREAVEALTVEVMAGCIKEVIESEGIPASIVVGHSMGGYVALAFAELYESNLKGMSMIHSTASQDTEEKTNNRLKAINIIKKGGKDLFVKQMMSNLFSGVFSANNKELVETQISNFLSIKGESLVAFYNAMIKRSDRSDILLNKAFPMQWIAGKDDVVTPLKSTMQHCISANVNFVSVYSNCAHMCMVEQEEQLYKDLSAFLEYCYQ